MKYLKSNNQIFQHTYFTQKGLYQVAVVAIYVDAHEGKGLWRAYIGLIHTRANEADELQDVADRGHKLNRTQALAMFPAINPDRNRNPI